MQVRLRASDTSLFLKSPLTSEEKVPQVHWLPPSSQPSGHHERGTASGLFHDIKLQRKDRSTKVCPCLLTGWTEPANQVWAPLWEGRWAVSIQWEGQTHPVHSPFPGRHPQTEDEATSTCEFLPGARGFNQMLETARAQATRGKEQSRKQQRSAKVLSP